MKRQSRETAFKVIYQIDMGKNDMETALQITMDNDGLNQKEQLFCRQLVLAVEEQLDEIDQMIQRNTTGWTIDRMMSVDRNLLRLAVYEIVYGGHITPEGAINEAVELAKVYGQKRSSAFVNSILDKVMKNEEKRSGNIVEAAEDAEETTAQETDAAPAEPVVIMHEISEEEAERLMYANRNEIE